MNRIFSLLKDKKGDAMIFVFIFLILLFGTMTIYQTNFIRLNVRRAQLSNAVASAALKAKWEGFHASQGYPDLNSGEIENKNLYFDRNAARDVVLEALRQQGFTPLWVNVELDDYYLYINGEVILPGVYLRKATEQRTMEFQHKVRLYKNFES